MRRTGNDLLCRGYFQMFNDEVAVKLGINCAIILQSLHRRLLYHSKKGTNKINGEFWNYCSLREWEKAIPFMKRSTINRTLKKLLKQLGLIKIGHFKKNGTAYYTINYHKLFELGFDLNCDVIEQAGLCGIEMYLGKRPVQNGSGYVQSEPKVTQSEPKASQNEPEVFQSEPDYIQ